MAKLIFFLVLCLSANCFAQSQAYTISTVVGDTTDFTQYSGLPGECQERLTLENQSSSDPSIIGPHNRGIRFIPKKNGIWFDTVTFHWVPTAGFLNEGCTDVYKTVFIQAMGIQDSSVKLRSTDIIVPMREKNPLGQWDGNFLIRLDNNIASVTTFKNFKLLYNLPPGLQIEILDGTQIITSYPAKTFERQKLLTVHLSLPGAPLADSVSFQGAMEVDAVSTDTTLKLISNLYVTIYPFAGSSVNTIPPTNPLSLHIYPNPLEKLAQITFTIPEQNACKLRLINMMGEEIRSIFNGRKSSGTYNISFDASDIVSGEYFCELQLGNSIAREKIIINK